MWWGKPWVMPCHVWLGHHVGPLVLLELVHGGHLMLGVELLALLQLLKPHHVLLGLRLGGLCHGHGVVVEPLTIVPRNGPRISPWPHTTPLHLARVTSWPHRTVQPAKLPHPTLH